MISPFENLSDLQKNKLLKILQTHTYSFHKNEEILPTLKNENIICILLEGEAHIVNIDYNGEENLIENLSANSVFGKNISNINFNDCHIKSLSESKVLVINYNNLINSKNICYQYYNLFILNLFNIINIKLKEANTRTSILTKKSIRDKLLAYLETEYRRTRSKYVYIPNNFKELADYLSVNRSAMFRELKNLKDDNLIKIDGKRITLLYVPAV